MSDSLIDTAKQRFEPLNKNRRFPSKEAFKAWLARHTAYQIHFEDHQQDFLTWYLDQGGEVLHCEPFQANIWNGTIVDLATLGVGNCPMIQLVGTADLRPLRHPVTKIEFNLSLLRK